MKLISGIVDSREILTTLTEQISHVVPVQWSSLYLIDSQSSEIWSCYEGNEYRQPIDLNSNIVGRIAMGEFGKGVEMVLSKRRDVKSNEDHDDCNEDHDDGVEDDMGLVLEDIPPGSVICTKVIYNFSRCKLDSSSN